MQDQYQYTTTCNHAHVCKICHGPQPQVHCTTCKGFAPQAELTGLQAGVGNTQLLRFCQKQCCNGVSIGYEGPRFHQEYNN